MSCRGAIPTRCVRGKGFEMKMDDNGQSKDEVCSSENEGRGLISGIEFLNAHA